MRGVALSMGAGNHDAARSLTPRELDVCVRFGVVPDQSRQALSWPREVGVRPGRIVLVCGPSGSGKSSLLSTLARSFPMARWVHELPFPHDVSVLDAVTPGEPLAEAVNVLTACSLGEPRLWLRRYHELSEGERFRARLARAISLQRRAPGAPLLCDEFGSSLHRRTAKAIAFNLRKLVSREALAFVVATAHDDLAADLEPDDVIRLSRTGQVRVESRTALQRRPGRLGIRRPRRPSFAKRLCVERGSMRDYAHLADLHYRTRDQIGCVDSVFVLRDRAGGEILGVAVYGHSPLELSLRNEATKGRFVRNAARLNREMRILRRLIVHPDVRGCGLGHWLVARTLPLAGTRYVECLAAMGLVNPVFEKAGMRCLGACPGAPRRERLSARLRELGADPFSTEFAREVCRQPRVRRIVAEAVFDWYRASTGQAGLRVARQGPAQLARTFRQLIGSRPVYYLWEREGPSREGDEPGLGQDGASEGTGTGWCEKGAVGSAGQLLVSSLQGTEDGSGAPSSVALLTEEATKAGNE